MATLIMEKEQVAALATSILQLLEELEKERADLPAVEEEPADTQSARTAGAGLSRRTTRAWAMMNDRT